MNYLLIFSGEETKKEKKRKARGKTGRKKGMPKSPEAAMYFASRTRRKERERERGKESACHIT